MLVIVIWFTKDLLKMAGNSISMRALYVVILIAIKSMNPVKLRDYLVG